MAAQLEVSMSCLPDAPYDVVVFLLDDMRFDQLDRFELTLELLAPSAVRLERAYVTTPLCAPQRANFLSGGYTAAQTGVLTNEAPTGGVTLFADAHTLPTRLQSAGYHTVILGKYMNGYDLLGGYVAPGWSVWQVNGDAGAWNDFTVMRGSSTPDAAGAATVAGVRGYVTDWHGEVASEILAAEREEPVFLYLSLLPPHHPHVPADADIGALAGTLYRDRARDEADVSDKPAWIQDIPRMSEDEVAEADQNNQERLESLLAADRAIASVVQAVHDAGRAEQTVFVLTSDNGQMWREHRLAGKGVGYEEAVRVPLLIAHPALSARSTEALVAMDLDLPATIGALAGLAAEGEGQDLRPLLCGETDSLRADVVLQGWEGEHPPWSGLVTPTEKYLETAGGERELYDLVADPYEELSLDADPALAEHMAELAASLDARRGLVITTEALPDATLDAPYEAALERWGGTAPLSWTLSTGALPEGLSLSADGVLSGTPREEGSFLFGVRVQDSDSSPVHGGPQTWTAGITLEVGPAEPKLAEPCGCAAGRPVGGWPALVALMLVWRLRQV